MNHDPKHGQIENIEHISNIQVFETTKKSISSVTGNLSPQDLWTQRFLIHLDTAAVSPIEILPKPWKLGPLGPLGPHTAGLGGSGGAPRGPRGPWGPRAGRSPSKRLLRLHFIQPWQQLLQSQAKGPHLADARFLNQKPIGFVWI